MFWNIKASFEMFKGFLDVIVSCFNELCCCKQLYLILNSLLSNLCLIIVDSSLFFNSKSYLKYGVHLFQHMRGRTKYDEDDNAKGDYILQMDANGHINHIDSEQECRHGKKTGKTLKPPRNLKLRQKLKTQNQLLIRHPKMMPPQVDNSPFNIQTIFDVHVDVPKVHQTKYH